MWLLITDLHGRILVCDYFADAFLFEVIAMFLETDGIRGETQTILLNTIQNGLLFTYSRNYAFTLIEPGLTE